MDPICGQTSDVQKGVVELAERESAFTASRPDAVVALTLKGPIKRWTELGV